MRLVGARDSFVRRPFLIDGFLKGIIGGLIALGLTWGTSSLVSHNLIQTSFFDGGTSTLGVLGGGVIGLLGSALSVGRHLRRV